MKYESRIGLEGYHKKYVVSICLVHSAATLSNKFIEDMKKVKINTVTSNINVVNIFFFHN